MFERHALPCPTHSNNKINLSIIDYRLKNRSASIQLKHSRTITWEMYRCRTAHPVNQTASEKFAVCFRVNQLLLKLFAMNGNGCFVHGKTQAQINSCKLMTDDVCESTDNHPSAMTARIAREINFYRPQAFHLRLLVSISWNWAFAMFSEAAQSVVTLTNGGMNQSIKKSTH